MKNLSLILNGILLLAVAYLYVDKFSADEKPEPVVQETGDQEQGLKIVYINVDSLHAKSISYQAISASIEKKYKETQASLRAKERAFQRDLEDYQKKYQAGTLTPKQAQEIEANLAQKQQAFAAQQERASKELNDETAAFDVNFIGNLTAIVDSLKSIHGYDYVLVDGGPVSPMLTASSSHDITNEVVELMNEKDKAAEN